MNYHVARNGQTYGPYPEEAVRKYLAEGSLLASDMARTEAMPNWVPLGQLLGGQAPAVFATPPAAASGARVNVPPGLHWVLVLIIGTLTGVFYLIWAFVQSTWVKSIDPTSRATRDLVIAMALPFAGLVIFAFSMMAAGISYGVDRAPGIASIGSLGSGILAILACMIAGLVFHLKAVFGMRDSLVRYYNTVEPINLRLSAIMTLFFNVLYFQYHFTRIAEWKRTGVLQPQQ